MVIIFVKILDIRNQKKIGMKLRMSCFILKPNYNIQNHNWKDQTGLFDATPHFPKFKMAARPPFWISYSSQFAN